MTPLTLFALFGVIFTAVTLGEVAAAMILGMFQDGDDEGNDDEIPRWERWDTEEESALKEG